MEGSVDIAGWEVSSFPRIRPLKLLKHLNMDRTFADINRNLRSASENTENSERDHGLVFDGLIIAYDWLEGSLRYKKHCLP